MNCEERATAQQRTNIYCSCGCLNLRCVFHLQSIWSNEHSNNLIQFVFCLHWQWDFKAEKETEKQTKQMHLKIHNVLMQQQQFKRFAVRLNWDFRLWYNQEENRLIASLFLYIFLKTIVYFDYNLPYLIA